MMPAGALGHCRRHRPEQLDPAGWLGDLARLREELQRSGSRQRRIPHRRQTAERWPGSLRPLIQSSVREPVVAFREQTQQQWMAGELGLDEHLAGAGAPSSATRDLNYGLREALGRTKVGTEQSLVRIQHDDERDVGKVV